MATKTLKTRLVLKNDTEANWTTNNPVLLKGEIGIAIDVNKIKIGDGTKKWNELTYSGVSIAEITDLISDSRDDVYVVTATNTQTDVEAITAKVTADKATLKKGDMAVVKRTIGETTKISYTSYVYDGTEWAAMDGNYSADNVYLSSDITMAGNYTAVGNLTKSQNGTATFSTKGKTVSEALTEIFTKKLQPSKSEPAVTISLADAKAVEAGTTVSPSFTGTLSAGSYTYGPATGVVATEWTVTEVGKETNATKTVTAAKATGTFDAFKIAAGQSYKVTATAKHGAGVVAKDNVGGNSNPEVKIAAGSKTGTSGAYTGYQQGYFIGTVTTKPGTVTSAIVRGLGTKKNGNYAAGNVNITVPVGAAAIIIACPATSTGMKKVLNTTVNADMTESFAKQTVKVAGADGDVASAFAKDYNVWVYTPAEAYGSTAALTITLG